MTWGHSFVTSNVRTELAQQQIFFPPKPACAHPKAGTEITPAMVGTVSNFAGQQLLTGQQAQVYANYLLEAFAFSKIGAVMLWGAIASFVLAALMSILVGLGFWHARRTEEATPVLTARPVTVQ